MNQEVIPAIIPESIDDLRDKMSLVSGITPLVQIDVCDGKFVPSQSWPYVGDYEETFSNIINESEGFPFWESLDFEADLMVADPENVVPDWVSAGAKRLILHIESSDNFSEIFIGLRKEYGYSVESSFGIELGIGINIETPDDVLDEFFTPDKDGKILADFVQFMGIDRIGYQHQKFDEKVLDKIRNFREKYPNIPISVDGGVGFDNARDLIDAGATRLVSGSAIFESENIVSAIEEMREV